MSEIINLLANDNYLVVNRDLIHAIGLECAVFLSEIAAEAIYWEKAGKMVDGWFFSTQENVESNVCINSYKQRKCIKELSALGVLEMEVRGMPATRYFRLNEKNLSCLIFNKKKCKNEQLVVEKLNNKLSKNYTTSCLKIEQPVVENLNTNNTKDNNTKNNSTDNSTKEEHKAAKPPKRTREKKHKHGEYQNVSLTDTEMQRLLDKLGNEKASHCIRYLDEYKERKGYKCKSDYLTILKWVVKAVDEEESEKRKGTTSPNDSRYSTSSRMRPLEEWKKNKQKESSYVDGRVL